jgi:hypothetical protein
MTSAGFFKKIHNDGLHSIEFFGFLVATEITTNQLSSSIAFASRSACSNIVAHNSLGKSFSGLERQNGSEKAQQTRNEKSRTAIKLERTK